MKGFVEYIIIQIREIELEILSESINSYEYEKYKEIKKEIEIYLDFVEDTISLEKYLETFVYNLKK